MASGKITGPIGRTIQAGKKRGLGAVAIAETVRKKHQVDLDRRSIDRWLAANPPAPPRRRSAPADTQAEATEPAKPAALDELETLEVQAVDLKRRLDTELMSVTARATLNRELRQTFASIRKVKEAATKSASVENDDARWMIAKLKRFAEQNAGPVPAETDGVPEAARAAGG